MMNMKIIIAPLTVDSHIRILAFVCSFPPLKIELQERNRYLQMAFSESALQWESGMRSLSVRKLLEKQLNSTVHILWRPEIWTESAEVLAAAGCAETRGGLGLFAERLLCCAAHWHSETAMTEIKNNYTVYIFNKNVSSSVN